MKNPLAERTTNALRADNNVYLVHDEERQRGVLLVHDFNEFAAVDPEVIRRHCTAVILALANTQERVIDFPVHVPIVVQTMADISIEADDIRLVWRIGSNIYVAPEAARVRIQVFSTLRNWMFAPEMIPRITFASHEYPPQYLRANPSLPLVHRYRNQPRRTSDGRFVFYKAVLEDWTTGGRYDKVVVYKPGSGPHTPYFFDPTPRCGNGLHLSSLPYQARSYLTEASRFVECLVDPEYLIPIDYQKVKVGTLTVGREVDLFGDVLDEQFHWSMP